MKIFKHYSFDLWMTLIRSHPAFKLERTRFFYTHFNTAGKTLDEVGIIFKQIDEMCNAINENTGNNLEAEEMYLMVISAINNHLYPLQQVNVADVYTQMEQLVFKYPPIIYCGQTAEVLLKLKQAAPTSTFSLLSNTAFIKGSTLRKVLPQINLGISFNFQLYSDETGMSKPNENLFKLLVNTVRQTRNEADISLKEIIHIGDNAKADIGGANKAGISSLLINAANKTILNLLS